MTDADKIKKLENAVENLERRLGNLAAQAEANFNKLYQEVDERLKKLEAGISE